MAEQAIDYSALGQRVAAEQRLTLPGDVVDWDGYGRAVSEAIGKGRGVPVLGRFLKLPAPVYGGAERVATTGAVQSSGADPSAPLAPRSVREVIRLRELGVLSKADARLYLGLRPHWWSR